MSYFARLGTFCRPARSREPPSGPTSPGPRLTMRRGCDGLAVVGDDEPDEVLARPAAEACFIWVRARALGDFALPERAVVFRPVVSPPRLLLLLAMKGVPE